MTASETASETASTPASPSEGATDDLVRQRRTEDLLREFHEESAIAPTGDARYLMRVWRYVRPYRSLVVVSLAFGLVIAAGGLVRPAIMRYAIDQGVSRGRSDVLMLWGGVLAAVVVVEQALSFVQMYAVQVAGARAVADLRLDVFRFLHRLRLSFFDTQPVGRLVTRVTNDADAILELFASGALNALSDLVKLVGIVIVMLSIDWQLSLIAFVAAPPVALLIQLVRVRARDAYRAIRAKTAHMNSNMSEQISGMTVVQAFSRQAAAATEFDAINASYRDANIRAIKYEATQDAAIEMISAICLASIVVSLGYRPATFGTIVAFNAYLVMFFEPISALAQRYTILQSALAGAERIFGLLDVDAADSEVRAGAPDGDPDIAIAYSDVSFEYKPGVPVLTDVSFEVRHGEKIAVVGPTGAGKSTVASIILRLYEPQQGTVRVDGRDVVTLEREQLRRRFAVVPQDVFLFPGTVASNVAAGEEVDLERVEAALRQLDAFDVFDARPGGLLAQVEEHGANFSAGERQLIAFARALYRDAPTLILDEATASVDSDTEARLQRALDALMKGRTSIVIAHRLSTVRAMDRILCFHKGRLAEQGSHSELLELGGLYARLHALHFAGQGSESRAPS